MPRSTAADVASALRATRSGEGRWLARCPAHDDRRQSLSIRDANGMVLVRCHAGCDQRDVIAALKARGLWGGKMRPLLRRASRREANEAEHDPQQPSRSAVASAIWQSTLPAADTAVEAYLATRGLTLPVPPSLRFHPGLKHPSGGVWPCMVALVTRGADGMPLAIHRTFLGGDGGKAPATPNKMMLGPCRGGVVRLADPDELLMVGEGIETCLAAMQATGHPAWAALSTSGLRALDLPERIAHVIVLADGDDPGEAAARDGALRWKRQGRRVRIARPPRGLDFNDVLLRRAPRIEGTAQ